MLGLCVFRVRFWFFLSQNVLWDSTAVGVLASVTFQNVKYSLGCRFTATAFIQRGDESCTRTQPRNQCGENGCEVLIFGAKLHPLLGDMLSNIGPLRSRGQGRPCPTNQLN